jgi:AraC-like DNA-binding protein
LAASAAHAAVAGQRYCDDAGADVSISEEGDAWLHRRFVALLERAFARRHGAAHYVDALGVAAPLLARALSSSAGCPTKALITDRVMLEASRLLRFADLQIGDIAGLSGTRLHARSAITCVPCHDSPACSNWNSILSSVTRSNLNARQGDAMTTSTAATERAMSSLPDLVSRVNWRRA